MATDSKPVLVTGAAGFIGSRFVESCNERGARVVSVDSESLFSNRPELEGIDFGTIVDTDSLPERLADMDFGSVLHLGACTDTTELDVGFLTRVNLEASQRLWNECTRRSIPFVYASSAATYGDGTLGFVDDESEQHRLQPLNPYGDSKLSFDLWAVEEERAGRVPPAWAGFKFFNVYGYGERHKGPMSSVVVQAFDQIRATGKLKLFRSHRADVEDGHQTRDFVFVDDVLDVLRFALEAPIERGIYNLGSGRARTFLDLGRAVFDSLGQECVIDWIPTPEHLRERYQYFTEADLQKLRAAGWARDFTPLEVGVQKTVERLLERA